MSDTTQAQDYETPPARGSYYPTTNNHTGTGHHKKYKRRHRRSFWRRLFGFHYPRTTTPVYQRVLPSTSYTRPYGYRAVPYNVVPYSAYHVGPSPYVQNRKDKALLYRCTWDPEHDPTLCRQVLDYHATRSYGWPGAAWY